MKQKKKYGQRTQIGSSTEKQKKTKQKEAQLK